MLVMLSTMAVMMALVPVMSTLWLLIITVLVLGMAEGTLHVGGNTLVVWVHGSKVGPFMNGLHFFFGVGALLSPLIVAHLLLITGDITWSFWALALLVVPSIIWLTRQPSPAFPTTSTNGPGSRANRFLIALFAFFLFLYVGIESSYSGWIFTYTLTTGLGAETTAAFMTSAFWGSLTLARLLAIPLAVRFRPRDILLSELMGALLSAGVIVIWPGSMAALWLGTLGMGLSLGSVFPTTMSLIERRMTMTGKITSWLLVGASLGGMSFPWLVGQFFEPVGPHVLPVITIAALALALGVLAALIRHSPDSNLPAATG